MVRSFTCVLRDGGLRGCVGAECFRGALGRIGNEYGTPITRGATNYANVSRWPCPGRCKDGTLIRNFIQPYDPTIMSYQFLTARSYDYYIHDDAPLPPGDTAIVTI